MCGIMVLADPCIELEVFLKEFKKIKHRGPDHTKLEIDEKGIWGFHRLSIMDLSDQGNQPFNLNKKRLVCNGEIFNFKKLKASLPEYTFYSESDCEVLIPLYETYGIEKMLSLLDGEFVFVLYDENTQSLMAARDPIGIRPMFYGYINETNSIIFASEAKALVDLCDEVFPFPPGQYYLNGEFYTYHDASKFTEPIRGDLDLITATIKDLLEKAIVKRLDSDAPIGFLLSGGLDSSLVCAIANQNLNQPIKTFAIGMDTDPIDLKYAKIVANHLKSEHTEVIISKEQVLEALKEVIYLLETWDVTTIRASIGMYLLCQYIRQNTDIKVLLTGEVSDELFGYKYTDFAPTANDFQEESQKRVRELYMYDVLRADRCISGNALEARVPFGDLDFVNFVMGVNPKVKMNQYQMGKYLLRKAFDGTELLPQQILFRDKAAFSDAVGHSLVDYLKEYAEKQVSDHALEEAKLISQGPIPYSKESLLYRQLFDSYYPSQSHWIKDYWMPNKDWEGCNVTDPSARVLSNYGKSGE
jgi:asparagine synthase (glutamine-hydrolysing)